MAKKPVKAQAKAKVSVGAKPKAKATAKAAPPAKKASSSPKASAKVAAKPAKKPLAQAPAKVTAKAAAPSSKKIQKTDKKPVKVATAKSSPVVEKASTQSAAAKTADKNIKPKKPMLPSVMGSKPKKDADEMEDDFLDDDIEVDPELAEFVEDVAELEEADAAAEKAIAGGGTGDEEEEEAAPLKKTPKEKSASERRIKKERDLLSGIDRNGDMSEIWQKFYETHKNEKPKPYNMRETFEAKSALQHVKLGWGFILSNINDRLEVLFKEGIKIQISNYKS